MKYTLRFPFEIVSDQQIVGLEKPFEWEANGLTFKLKSQSERFYVFVIDGFDSIHSAEEYVRHTWVGLNWALLQHGVAFRANTSVGEVAYAKNPQQAAKVLAEAHGIPIEDPVDGLFNGDCPVISPSDERLYSIRDELVTTRTIDAGEFFCPTLAEGMTFPNDTKVISDEKLKLALGLYNEHFFERSTTSRFLTLVMVLETLAVRTERPSCVRDLLSKWQTQLGELENQLFSESSEELVALEALRNELLHKREMSIRYSIQVLVYNALKDDGEDESTAMNLAGKAKRIYDSRSTLLHEGTLSLQKLNEAAHEAREVAKRVLTIKFRNAVESKSCEKSIGES